MNRLTIIASLLVIGSVACKQAATPLSESEQLLARIDSMETVLFADKGAKADTKQGMDLIREYARYYQASAKDSLGIDMLFKAGEVSMGIGQGNLAVKYFRTISEEHQDFHKAPEALFLCGFSEENLNRDTAQARFFYERFLQVFPEHKLAEDAKFSIQNMSLSDEDLIRMFEQNMKQGS